jgi:outer membrane lipoprotein LolB
MRYLPEETLIDQQKKLAQLTHWCVIGRVGIINGQYGWHANFQWDQQDHIYRIKLVSPLGQNLVLIEGDRRTVVAYLKDGQHLTALDPDTLLEQVLGFAFPISGLQYWLRGLPDPVHTTLSMHNNANGQLTRLEQNGWLIDYPAYVQVAFQELPASVIMRHQDWSIKLVIEQWLL